MHKRVRSAALWVAVSYCVAAFSGCATVPGTDVPPSIPLADAKRPPAKSTPAAQQPAPISFKADAPNPKDSTFNTRVIDGASTLEYSFATSTNPQVEEVTRLESSWTRKFEEANRQLKLGDAVSSPGGWGNAVRFAGVQLTTDTQKNQEVLAAQRFAMPGLSVLPTTADALLASAGAKDTTVARQNMTVNGRVKVASANTLSFAARDALGRNQSFTRPLVESTRLVSQGCARFALDLGRVREDYALESNTYGSWFANTMVACGVPLGLTLEGHGEFLGDQGGTVGVGLARKVPAIGVASIGVASSQADEDSGWLARFGLEHSNSLFDFKVRTRVQSPGYRAVGSVPLADPVARTTVASVGLKVSPASDVAVVYASEATQANDVVSLLALSQRMNLGTRGALSMTAGHSLNDSNIMSVFLSFTRAFGRRIRQASDLPDTLELIRVPQHK